MRTLGMMRRCRRRRLRIEGRGLLADRVVCVIIGFGG
jgi:hypothetical protein